MDVLVQAKLLKKYVNRWLNKIAVDRCSFTFIRNDDTTSSSTDPYTITSAGFQFLLMNRRLQVWLFIIHMLEIRQVDNPCASRSTT
jgi:hypothetical protein